MKIQIQYLMSKTIDDWPILITETVAIQEVVQMVIQMELSNFILESDSQLAF